MAEFRSGQIPIGTLVNIEDDDMAVVSFDGVYKFPYKESGSYSDRSLWDEIKELKQTLLTKTPLNKCIHCGQWGAAYCPCAHCGAPIDPGEPRKELQ